MSTLGQLIDYMRHGLSGGDRAKSGMAALISGVDADDLTLSLDGVQSAGRSLMEIDMELVAVKSFDATSSVATVWPFGRGYRSTTAASHSAGAEVRIDPAWPSSTIARAINDAITEFYPTLYAVASQETVFPADDGALGLTDTPVGVISVWVEDPHVTDGWVREDRWDFNPDASSDGRNLRVGGHWEAGRAVRVVYAARPGTFNLAGALSQDFATVTGLPARHESLLLLAVAYRMAAFIDVSKLPFLPAEARAEGESRPGGAATARLLYTMFQARLQDEAAALVREHPIRLHRVR